MRDTGNRTISLKVPRELYARVSRLAARAGKSRSQVIREAIEAHAAPEGPTVGKVWARYCGIMDGPADLSTNPMHLEGFGRG